MVMARVYAEAPTFLATFAAGCVCGIRAGFSHPRVSPDGQHVVVQAAGEFWIHDVMRHADSAGRATHPTLLDAGRAARSINAQGSV